MNNPTFTLNLTDDQIRVLCEGMKLVMGNPASASEHATADQLLQHFYQLLGVAPEARAPGPKLLLVDEIIYGPTRTGMSAGPMLPHVLDLADKPKR